MAVAIIGVLVAVAIPVFSTQLEKSREATDLANVRSAYAEVMTAVLTEDTQATHNGMVIHRTENGESVYQASVPLKQLQAGWQTSASTLVMGGISSTDRVHWVDEPEKNGACIVRYARGEMILEWGGVYHDYFGVLSRAVLKDGEFGNPGASNVLNSTYGSASSRFASIIAAMKAASFDDLKTWAIVRDPSDDDGKDPQNAKNYNYLVSTVSITDASMRDKQIPVMYINKNGEYTVGYATVRKAPDGNYNVITVSGTGTYPQEGKNNNYDPGYKSIDLVSSPVSYSTDRYAAQRAYRKLVEQYLNGSSGTSGA